MRSVLLLICIFLLPAVLVGQDYFVLNVKGKVLSERTGKAIAVRELMKETDRVIFSSSLDRIELLHLKSGRFIAKPRAVKKSEPITGVLKDITSPGSYSPAVKAGSFKSAEDIRNYYKDSVMLLVEQRHYFSRKQFPVSKSAFFFIRYNYSNQIIEKPLVVMGDSLIINRTELFMNDKKQADPARVKDMKLLYNNGKTVTDIASVKLICPDGSDLTNEISLIRIALDRPNVNLKNEILGYLFDVYGRVTSRDFEEWYLKLGK